MQDASDLKAAEPESMSAFVYADLRQKLIIGELKPAERLSIRKLAEEYAFSAMPVREALRQLASENALVGAARKAYRVPDLTPTQAADLFYIRAVLEGAAAETAATRLKQADFDFLSRMTEKMEQTWVERDPVAFLLANHRFHSRIYGVAGNNALKAIMDGLYVQTGPWLAHGIVNLVNPDNWMSDHNGIINALRTRDAATARRLMEEDARWGVDLFRGVD